MSELALGTWQTMSDTEAMREVFFCAAEAGVNLIDTADSYEGGTHETLLGKWLREASDHWLVATKTFFPVDSGDPGGLAPQRLRKALEGSLRRLGRDAVDLYQFHRFDAATPVQDVVAAAGAFLTEGKIRFWGISRWPAEKAAEAERIASDLGIDGPCTHQYHCNLLTPTIDEPGLIHTSPRLKAALYSPLAQGVLTGKYSAGVMPPGSRAEDPEARSSMWDLRTEKLRLVSQWEARCRAEGMTLPQFALAWCLSKPHVGTVLTGLRCREQLVENLGYLNIPDDRLLFARILA